MQYLSTGAELAAHHEAKHKMKDELCTVCGKRFTKKAHLHEHQKGVHEQDYNLKARLVCPFTSCTKMDANIGSRIM